MKLADFVKTEYEREHIAVRIRKGSQQPTRSSLQKYIVPILGDLELDKVSAYHLTKFRNELHRKGLSAKTIRNHQSVLRTVLKLAFEAGEIPAVPFIKSEKFRATEMAWLRAEEERRLLQYAALAKDFRWHAMIVLGLNTGMRVGEMRGLQWKHYTCENGLWELNIVQSVPMQGNKVQTTKTGAFRKVAVNERTRVVLQSLRALTGRCDFLFSDPKRPQAPATNKACRVAIETIRDRAKLPACGWHTLRHTVATKLVHKPGISIVDVKNLLGHVDIKMTMRYVGRDLERARLTTAALDDE